MPIIELKMVVAAPIERVFDLSRCIELHVRSTDATSEVPVAGVTSGLMVLDDEVTWEATHLGVRQRLTSRITAFERPSHFRDSMVQGAFHSFDHDHFFRQVEGGTLLQDRFDYRSPLGPLGLLADLLFLERYMEGFLRRRNEVIKATAESEDWREFLPEEQAGG